MPVPSKATPNEWSGTCETAVVYESAEKMADDGEILKALGYTTVGIVTAEVIVSDDVNYFENIGARWLPDVDVALRVKAKAFMTPDTILGFVMTVHGMKVYSKAEPETKH